MNYGPASVKIKKGGAYDPKEKKLLYLLIPVCFLCIGYGFYLYHVPRGYYGDAQHYTDSAACSIYVSNHSTNSGSEFGILGSFGRNRIDGTIYPSEAAYNSIEAAGQAAGIVGPLKVWYYNADASDSSVNTDRWDAANNPQVSFTYRKNRSCRFSEIKIYRWPLSVCYSDEVRSDTFRYSEEVSFRWTDVSPLLGISQGTFTIEKGYLYSFFIYWEENGHSNFCEYNLVS